MVTSSGLLLIQQEGKVIQTLLLNMPTLTIGRAPENDLSLSHQLVSRNHAELHIGPQGALLTDLGSSNGTFIGEQRLLPNTPLALADGVTFRIGPFLLTYRAARSAALPLTVDDEPPIRREATAVVPVPVVELPTILPQAPEAVLPSLRSRIDEPDSIYRRYLPDIFQENDFLRRFLLIFQEIWEPLEQRQDHIALYFDPRTCPTSYLPWLASWLDLPLNMNWPEARVRRLLAQAMDLYSWRGTRYGLVRMIEVCTGLTPVITDIPSRPFVIHIRVSLPPGGAADMLDKDLVEQLVQAHKPAHVGYVLEFSI